MSKETYTRMIERYFSYQTEKSFIDNDITQEHLDDLNEIYGLDVTAGSHVYRYFIYRDEKFTLVFFNEQTKATMLRDVLMSDLKFVEDRLGIPVFG